MKMDVIETGLGGMEWIGLVQGTVQWRILVNVAMKLQVPYNARKFLKNGVFWVVTP
jgi:hypothetical protein